MESYGKFCIIFLFVAHFSIVPITGELLRWIFVHDILQCGNAISSNCMCCREQNAPCGKESHGWIRESWTAEFCCQRWWCAITGRQEKHSLPICLAYSRTIWSGNTVFGLCLGIRIFVWMTMFDNIWLTSTRSFHRLQLPKHLLFLKKHVVNIPLRTQTPRASSGEFWCVSFLHGIASLDARTSTWEFAESPGTSDIPRNGTDGISHGTETGRHVIRNNGGQG